MKRKYNTAFLESSNNWNQVLPLLRVKDLSQILTLLPNAAKSGKKSVLIERVLNYKNQSLAKRVTLNVYNQCCNSSTVPFSDLMSGDPFDVRHLQTSKSRNPNQYSTEFNSTLLEKQIDVLNPLVESLQVITAAQRVPQTRGFTFRTTFHVPPDVLNSVHMNPNQYGVILYCVNSGGNPCWPKHCTISLNNNVVSIDQRNPPGVHAHKAIKEKPVEFKSNWLFLSNNVLNVKGTNDDGTVVALGVRFVRKKPTTEIVESVMRSNTHPQAVCLQRVQKMFEKQDEDDIVAESLSINLKDPVSFCRINHPARGMNCDHPQCFDLATYLEYQKISKNCFWNCPICKRVTKVKDVVIDTWFQNALDKYADESEVDRLDFDESGIFKVRQVVPSSSTNNNSIRRNSSTASMNSIPAAATSSSSHTAPSQSSCSGSGGSLTNAGTSASTAVAIDLCFSDDDGVGDNNIPLLAGNSNVANTTSPSSYSHGANLNNDESFTSESMNMFLETFLPSANKTNSSNNNNNSNSNRGGMLKPAAAPATTTATSSSAAATPVANNAKTSSAVDSDIIIID